MNPTVQERGANWPAPAKVDEYPLGVVDWMLWSCLVAMTLGFCVYHYALLNGNIPPVFGGYSTAISLIVAPVVLPVYIYRLSTVPKFMNIADWLLILFTTMVLIITVISRNDVGLEEIADSQLAVVPQFAAWFTLFRCLRLGDRRLRLPTIAVLSLMSLILLIRPPIYVSSVADIASLYREDVADYQSYALVYLIVLIYTLAIIGRNPLRYLAYMIGAVALFVNGARAELIALPLVIASFEIFYAVKFPVFLGALFIIGSTLSGFILDLLADLFPTNRFILLLIDTGDDVSYSERSYFLQRALDVIAENPIWGSYGSYPAGEYAHNILSAWVDFGLFGFLLFGSMLAMGLINSVRAYRENRDLHLAATLAAVALCSVVLFVTAKYWTYQMLPILMALQARLIFWRNSSHSGRSN